MVHKVPPFFRILLFISLASAVRLTPKISRAFLIVMGPAFAPLSLPGASAAARQASPCIRSRYASITLADSLNLHSLFDFVDNLIVF